MTDKLFLGALAPERVDDLSESVLLTLVVLATVFGGPYWVQKAQFLGVQFCETGNRIWESELDSKVLKDLGHSELLAVLVWSSLVERCLSNQGFSNSPAACLCVIHDSDDRVCVFRLCR